MAIISGNLAIDTRNTNTAIAFHDDAAEWKKVFPSSMPVESLYTWYPYFDEKAYVERDDRANYRMGMTTTPKEISLEYTKKELVIEGYEAVMFKSQQEITEEKAGSLTDVEDDMTKAVVKKLNHLVDLDFIDLLESTALWPDGAVSAVWTDLTNGDPELDLRAVRRTIINNSRGLYAPNTLIIPTYSLDLLFMHSKIKSRYDNVLGSQDEKKAYFLNLLGLENLVEIRKAKNTAAKNATPSFSAAMSAKAWMGYIDPNPSRERPTAMAPMVPKEYVGNDTGVAITKMSKMGTDTFEDGRAGIKIVGKQFTAIKQVSSELGYVLTGIHS